MDRPDFDKDALVPELKIYIHIGAHKTASTFLQTNVFTNIQDASHFYLHNSSSFYVHLDQLLRMSPDALKRDYMHLVNKLRQQLMALLPKKCSSLVLSDEGIIGTLNNSYQDAYIRAINLKTIFPEAVILLFIRRQDSFLESAYQQTVKEGCSIPLNKYLGIKRVGNKYETCSSVFRFAKFEADKLKWIEIIDTYSDIFGISNLHIFSFEMLKDKPMRIVTQLEATLQCRFDKINFTKKYNPSLSFISFWLCYLLNPIRRNDVNRFGFWPRFKLPITKSGFLYRYIRKILNVFSFPGPFILLDRYLCLPSYSRFSPNLKQQIVFWHREHNKRLAEKYDLLLKEYDYY